MIFKKIGNILLCNETFWVYFFLKKTAQVSFLVHEKEVPIGWGAIEASKPLEGNRNDINKETREPSSGNIQEQTHRGII